MSLLWRRQYKRMHSKQTRKNPSPHNKKNNLTVARQLDYPENFFIKEISADTFWNRKMLAGMTVEASILLPLCLFFFLNLGSAIEMIRLHGNLQMALWETGNRLAVYGALLEEGQREYEAQETQETMWSNLAGTAFSYLFVKNQIVEYLGEEYLNHSPLRNGTDSLQFWECDLKNERDEMELVMTYGVKSWTDFIGIRSFRMANCYYGHLWTGYDILGGTDATEDMLTTVYVTETGEVYHKDRNCTHLQISVREIPQEAVGQYRNEKGGRYAECEKCKGTFAGGSLYITREGDCFHYNRDCPGIKRTVYAILLREAGEYRPCSRCGT